MTEFPKSTFSSDTFTALSGPALSIVLSAFGISSAAVTLPEVSDQFLGQGFDPTLIVSSYILAITAFIVPLGRAGDLFGKRATLIFGLCLFILGALLAFAALTLPVLIVSRFIQGTGAAAMMAMPLALVRDHASTGQLGRWMGIMGTMQAIGTASGPAVGGVAVAALGWRAVFLMQIPMAFAAILLCLVYLQKGKRSPQQGDVDLLGVGVLVVGLGAVTFLLSDLANGFDVSIVVLALIAGASLAAFLVIEANTSTPIIPIPLLRSRHFLVSLSTNAIVSLVMMGMLVVGPFFLVSGLALSTAQMGLVMSVGPISSALSGIPAGRFTEQVGAGRAVITGVWAMGIACAAMAILPYYFGLGGFIVAFILLAPSYQVFLAALNTSVMVKAAEQDRGLVAGILNFSRNFGFIVGAGAISAVFWSLSRMEIGIEDGAQPISFAMAGTFAMCSLVLFTWAPLMAFARRDAN